MLLVNTETIPGKKIVKSFGIVRGNVIRAKHIGKDITAALRQLVGGSLPEYEEMLTEARSLATARMVEEAEKLGADAVVNIRYTTSTVMQGAAEILVVGTAVQVIDE
ncbi:MAG: YbjQ family protein [Firmicutes bacterium]|nr:YbjQ family protein [Bacillota bacterium]